MADHALASAGAAVVLTTSTDERHPAENIIDGGEATFWPTTGLYPQEFVISLKENTQIAKIKTSTVDVKKLTVERSEGPEPDKFEKVFEVEIADKAGRMQAETHKVHTSAKFLKFVIGSGWDTFSAVHKVSVMS